MSSLTYSHRKNSLSSSHKDRSLFWYILLFMYVFNFLGIGDIFPLIVFPYILYVIATSKFSKSFMFSLIMLACFSLMYALLIYYYNYSPIVGVIGRLVYPTLFLLLGYKLIDNKINYKKIINFLFVIIIGLTLYGFLSLMKSLSLYGSMEGMMATFGGRNVLNLWGDGFISATALTAYLSFSLAFLPLLFIKGFGKPEKMLMFILFLMSIYTINQTSSRTGILIIVFSVITVILFSDRISGKKVTRIFGGTLGFFLVAFLYSLNIFNVKSNITNTYLYQRILNTNIGNDSRVMAWETVLSNIFTYPLGGRGVSLRHGYAHNLWLDVGYDAGLIPLVFLMIFTIGSLFSVAKLLKSNHPIYVKALVISMLTAFFVIFMFEPVLQGITVYFMVFCFFIGVIYKINYLNGLNKNEQSEHTVR